MSTRRRITVDIKIILLHIAVLLVAYILQALIFPHLRILGTAPVILPVVVVGAGMFEGTEAGGFTGLFAGVLCDLAFNQPTIMFTLVLTAVGMICGILTDRLVTKELSAYVVMNLLVLIIIAFIQIFYLLFVKKVEVLPLLLMVLMQTVYSMIFAIPSYFIMGGIGRYMQRTKPQ